MTPAASGLHSALYRGTILHERRTPFTRAFRYPVHMLYVDLDELARGALPIGESPSWWMWFRRADYLGPAGVPLAEAVRGLVHARTGTRVEGPVRVLTNVRSLGYTFNPVTLYYCFQLDGALGAVVAEIHNTPWGERHAYVIDAASPGETKGEVSAVFDKVFHVSPFFGMNQRYHWRLGVPGDKLHVAMENREDAVAHVARLELKAHPLTRRSLAAVFLQQPAMGLAVHARIYAQALRLYLRGAPFHPHPRPEAP